MGDGAVSEPYRNKDGEVFWHEKCEDAVEAIKFAVEDLDDEWEKVEFIRSWYEGDVAPWPKFLKRVGVE